MAKTWGTNINGGANVIEKYEEEKNENKCQYYKLHFFSLSFALWLLLKPFNKMWSKQQIIKEI